MKLTLLLKIIKYFCLACLVAGFLAACSLLISSKADAVSTACFRFIYASGTMGSFSNASSCFDVVNANDGTNYWCSPGGSGSTSPGPDTLDGWSTTIQNWCNATSSFNPYPATNTITFSFAQHNPDKTSATRTLEFTYNATTNEYGPINTNCYLYDTPAECVGLGGAECRWTWDPRGCFEKELVACSELNCEACTTQAACEAAGENCAWNTAKWEQFKAVLGFEGQDTTPGCYSKAEPIEDSTSTKSEGYGFFREIFNNRIPFAWFYQVTDIFNAYSATSGDTGSSSQISLLTLTFPTTTISSTTVFSRLNLPIIDRDVFFRIMPLSAWHSLRDWLGFGLYIGLGFWLFRKLKDVQQMHI